MDKAVRDLVTKGRRIAARHLETAEDDIVYSAGAFAVAGTDRIVSLFDLARLAKDARVRGEIEEDLDTRATTEVPQSFPNGCHIAEVEIDPDTGRLAIVGYAAIDDCGTVLDHTIVEGQVIGSLAQGIGQTIGEHLVYDRESGQLLTATFNDYVMPLAADMPPVNLDDHPVPCRTNPLGVKGVGEAGTTGALAAVMNAVGDAIPDGRGWEIDMPATPEKIWRACRSIAWPDGAKRKSG
jgi:carbon-monoxide dehydrogenase large subunit